MHTANVLLEKIANKYEEGISYLTTFPTFEIMSFAPILVDQQSSIK